MVGVVDSSLFEETTNQLKQFNIRFEFIIKVERWSWKRKNIYYIKIVKSGSNAKAVFKSNT